MKPKIRQKQHSLIALSVLIGLFLTGLIAINGCVKNDSSAENAEKIMIEQITIEGTYIKDLGHPFSGPAIRTIDGDYRISGEKAEEINALEDGTKINVTGIESEIKRIIPEAGKFVEIREKNIEAISFTIIY